MKKIFTVFCLFVASLFYAQAYDFFAVNDDGVPIYYDIDESNASVTYDYWGCYSGNVVIPQTVTHNGASFAVASIHQDAFAYCSDLTSVTIPESVTYIGSWAFFKCYGLTSVTIPKGVTSLGTDVFFDCSGLTSIDVATDNLKFKSLDGVLYTKNQDTLMCYPAGKQGTSFAIPESVTSIGSSAFSGCIGLTSVSIPESVTSIGSSAFRGCSGLTSVYTRNPFPQTIDVVFSGVNLANVHLHVPACALSAYQTADVWKDFATITGEDEFSCNLNVWHIGSPTATDVTATYDGSTLTISGTGNMQSWGYSATPWYGYRSNITSVVANNGITSIGECAFQGCSSLTSVTIPEGVTSIGEYAFQGCSSLTSVTIPESVTSIGSLSFSNCSSLTSVAIPESVTSIGNLAFSNCSSLATIDVVSDNLTFKSVNGVLYTKNQDTLICYPKGKQGTSFAIPEGVTSIWDYAFSDCSGLMSVTIPEGVTSLGNSAFSGCSGLISVTIPEGVTSIGNSAFFTCSGLTSVAIPEGVTSIGNGTFDGCNGLTSVTIPEGVTSIGDAAFMGCSGLSSVTIPESVTSLGRYAFSNCSGLTSVTIPEGVTSIGNFAFSGCSGLISVYTRNPFPLSYVFDDVTLTNAHLYVPACALSAYQNADGWKDFGAITGVEEFSCTVSYVVTFDATGGSPTPAPQTIEQGEKATPPATPTRTGYTFAGWYKEAVLTTVWNFAVDVVTGNITLYAKWIDATATTYTVTFNSNGGSAVGSQTVGTGAKVSQPAAPTRTGYTFAGWYKEAALTTVWNFATDVVTGNITLYAKWTANAADKYTVTFYLVQGNTYDIQQITAGSTATKPADPVREGYTFAGWYNGEFLWNFSSPVTGNLSLTAKWKEGITGYEDELQITTNLHPNPFTGTLHLIGAEGCVLQVITVNGAVVHMQKVVNPDETINLEKLPAGLYFFRLEKDGKTKTIKAVKN